MCTCHLFSQFTPGPSIFYPQTDQGREKPADSGNHWLTSVAAPLLSTTCSANGACQSQAEGHQEQERDSAVPARHLQPRLSDASVSKASTPDTPEPKFFGPASCFFCVLTQALQSFVCLLVCYQCPSSRH